MPEMNRRWTLAARPHGCRRRATSRSARRRSRRSGTATCWCACFFCRSTRPARLARGSPELSAAGAARRGDARGRVAEVVESKHPGFARGDLVQGMFGWQDYALIPGALLGAKLRAGVPPTWSLGVLGVTGLTAYFGMLDLGKPKAGESVVVSGAAGATGSVADRSRSCRARMWSYCRRSGQVRVAHEGGALRRRDRLQARGRRARCASSVRRASTSTRQRRRRDPRRVLGQIAQRARIVLCAASRTTTR